MRRPSPRSLVLTACAAAASASSASGSISAFLVPVPIPPAAINDDPQLANMQSWDIMVSASGDWTSAAMEMQLPQGFNFYNHAFGGSTKPSPALVNLFPALAFDTYVTAPSDTGTSGAPALLSGFPETQPMSMSGNRISVSWGNFAVDAPGTNQIARFTFPQSVLPNLNGDSYTAQTNPDAVALMFPLLPAVANWINDADGFWHDGSNWSTGQPPNGNVMVTIDVGGGTVRTITHSQGNTGVHQLTTQEHFLISGGTFSTINSAAIAAANGVTLDGGTLRAGVNGSPLTIGPAGGRLEESPVLHNGLIMSEGDPLVVAGALQLNGISTLSNGGMIRFEGNRSLAGAGTIVVPDRAQFDVDAAAVLTLPSAFQMTKAGPGVLRINGRFVQTSTSTLDIADGSLINDYTGESPVAAIRSSIISGYNNGSWDGNGINSSTAAADDSFAVGYAEAAALFSSFPASFMGESIDNTTVLIRLTRSGDANLDGVVNLADFNRLAANFGASGAVWSQGDFNYDGVVNLADFNLLAANFGLSAGPDGPTPEDWSNLASAVPEPGALGGLLLLLLPPAVRRRRRG